MNDLARLRDIVARRLGLGLEEVRDGELQTILERRMAAHNLRRPAQYLQLLQGGASDEAGAKEEATALGQLLTVGETFFFRGASHFRVLRETILPALWRKQKEVHVLSAACSSGEEPYSLAMTFHDEGWDGTRRRAHIDAVDLDRRSLAKAKAGVYSTWSLRETTLPQKQRWFTASGAQFRLSPSILAAVQFHNENLLELETMFAAESFDIVFCRNALMYLTPESTRAVVDQIESLLVPGGHFFVSEAETLRGITDRFELVSTEGAFYYRRPLRAEEAPRSLAATAASMTPPATPRPSLPIPSPPPPSVEAGPASGPADVDPFAGARALFQRERFAEALADLASARVPAGRLGELALFRAVAQLGTGDVDAAETTARALLEGVTRSADAHMVVALAAEHRADPAAAREHHHAALYLDPSFALARLHLGRIDRREGKLADARRELRQALELLAHEDPLRLVLFGGGFSRAGLVALCRSELLLVERSAG